MNFSQLVMHRISLHIRISGNVLNFKFKINISNLRLLIQHVIVIIDSKLNI